MSSSSKDICTKCSKLVADCDKGLQCELCQQWFHAPCVNITAKNYELIGKIRNVHWFCDLCDVGNLIGELADFRDFRTQHAKLSEDIVAINTKLEKTDNAIKQMNNSLQTSMEECIQSHVNTAIKEELNIERRKMNVCVFGFSGAHGVDDETSFKELCTSVLQIPQNDVGRGIIRTTRLGRPTAGNQKPLPLLIQLSSLDFKHDILKNAKKLKYLHQENNLKVFIAPDLTPQQQAQQRELRVELKQRKDNGEDVFIKQGKIVNRSNADLMQPRASPGNSA